ncbi:MAG: peroxiredoxin [Acidimicrobiales bacterium]|nr:peroxiredoxin [Acidimicrobiales bacterium]
MSLLGKEVDSFSAKGLLNGEYIDVSEENLKGSWSIVFFYPADFTYVCPTELGDLADNYEEFKSMDVEIFAVSTDTHHTHHAWHTSSETIAKIDFPMVADPTGAICRNFDVYIEEDGLADRGTFIIDPDGKIVAYEIHPDEIGRNVSELMRKVKAAQYTREHPNEVCPAAWEEGQATLEPSIDLTGKI